MTTMRIGIKTGENGFEEEGPAEEWSALFPKYHADALVSADFAIDAHCRLHPKLELVAQLTNVFNKKF